MGTIVQQYVALRRRMGEKQRDMQVTVRLGQLYGAKLEHLAEVLSAAKTNLAGELLQAAISDAWAELGLPEDGAALAVLLRNSPSASREAPDKTGVSVPATWIFQANPKKYDIRQALARIDEHDRHLSWLTTRHWKEIRSSGTAYIWASGLDGGIIADTVLTRDPEIRISDNWEMQFALDAARFKGPDRRAEVRIKRILPRPITRSELENHPVLKSLVILKFWQQTNFRVSPEQAGALAVLFEQRFAE